MNLIRLSSADVNNLRLETQDTPMHFCALAMLESAPLVDNAGEIRLDELRAHLDERLAPVLRQRLFWPGALRGPPLWVDDAGFDIRHHILARRIPLRDTLESAVEPLVATMLDRSKPLWQMVFFTGLGDRVALLIKLHHAIADGLAAVAMLGGLFGLENPVHADALAHAPIPTEWQLLADNLRRKAELWRRLRTLGTFSGAARELRRTLLPRAAAPRSSLNHPVRAGRRICHAKVDLEVARARAHSAGGHINDALLDIVAAALRPLLAARGELMPGLTLKASVPVSLRSASEAGALGNRVGGVLVDLPVGEADADRRLRSIVASTRQAKVEQTASLMAAFAARLSATRFARELLERQRWVNVFVTNVPGPPAPIHLFGARILDVVPIVVPAGNVGAAFAGLSYAGSFHISATLDARRFPDAAILAAGLEAATAAYGANASNEA